MGKSSRARAGGELPRLLVFDFDGVLTDNRVLVMETGVEAVFCNRSDGLAFDLFRRAGIPAMILSTETNPVVSMRGRKLKVPVVQGVGRKAEVLEAKCREMGVELGRVLYAGNDLNDFEAMRLVGWPVCPADSHVKIRRISRVVLKAKGGGGVAREIAERVLRLDYLSPG